MIYAADTSTSVEKTRAELETVIRKFGADAFGYMTDADKAMISFRASGKYVRFILPLPPKGQFEFTTRKVNQHSAPQKVRRNPVEQDNAWEQGCRSAWRALFLAVKAKLVAVEAKIATFEQEFMAYVVLPNGRTAGEEILPQIDDAYRTGQMPAFTLALPAPTNGATP